MTQHQHRNLLRYQRCEYSVSRIYFPTMYGQLIGVTAVSNSSKWSSVHWTRFVMPTVFVKGKDERLSEVDSNRWMVVYPKPMKSE